MIKAIRITIAAYTASFRVPHFVGHQLTLTVPPLSTIYGLISAAAGKWIMPDDVEWLAYRCEYKSKTMDTETILTVERSKPSDFPRFDTRNVLPREFLVMPRLTLYLPPEVGNIFRCPRYSLLLGRTQDVATVEDVKHTALNPVQDQEKVVSGVLLPFELVVKSNASALLQNLPVAFTDESVRQPLRMHIFGIIDAHRRGEVRNANRWLAIDEEDGVVVPIFRREWVLYGSF